MSYQNENRAPHGVRFSSANQEIEPDSALQYVDDISKPESSERGEMSPEEQDAIRQNLAATLQKSRVQNFSFEPVSLPVSRVSSTSLPCG